MSVVPPECVDRARYVLQVLAHLRRAVALLRDECAGRGADPREALREAGADQRTVAVVERETGGAS